MNDADQIGWARIGSYRALRVQVRWRIAVALCLFFIATVLLLAVFNARSGHQAVVTLDLVIAGVLGLCLVLLFVVERERSGLGFFVVVALIFAFLPVFGWTQGRSFHYWYYLFPVSILFVLPVWPMLALSTLYGAMAVALSLAIMGALDTARLGLSYFVLVGFLSTYSFLEHRAAGMLRYCSERDPLSNCLNRRTLNEWLERLDQQPAGRPPCALLLLDIDFFKAINDRHGHLVGDRIITQVAAALGAVLSSDSPLYRYGGEEFAILVPECDDPADAMAVAERLRSTIAAQPFGDIRLTVSIGVAVWTPGSGRIFDALEAADAALYEAKRQGRNCVRLAA